jgi:hypothetical protein
MNRSGGGAEDGWCAISDPTDQSCRQIKLPSMGGFSASIGRMVDVLFG